MENPRLNAVSLRRTKVPGHLFVFHHCIFKERNGQSTSFQQIPAWHVSLYSPKSGNKIPKDMHLGCNSSFCLSWISLWDARFPSGVAWCFPRACSGAQALCQEPHVLVLEIPKWASHWPCLAVKPGLNFLHFHVVQSSTAHSLYYFKLFKNGK